MVNNNMTQTIPSSSVLEGQRIAIALSREEVFIVMRLLKAKDIPGFDLSWLNIRDDGTAPDEVMSSLESATNALIARGYLTPDAAAPEGVTKMDMPSPVIALVGACAFGVDSILLSLHKPDGPKVIYLHELRELGVVHTMPFPDIHRFEAVEGRPGVLRVIEETLGLRTQPALVLPAQRALVVDVQAARDAALAGRVDEAEGFLLRSGLSSTTAQVLSKAMKAATALGAISIIKRDADGQPHATTLALVITPTMCFTLADDAPGTHPARFLVQPVSADALRHWITETLP